MCHCSPFILLVPVGIKWLDFNTLTLLYFNIYFTTQVIYMSMYCYVLLITFHFVSLFLFLCFCSQFSGYSVSWRDIRYADGIFGILTRYSLCWRDIRYADGMFGMLTGYSLCWRDIRYADRIFVMLTGYSLCWRDIRCADGIFGVLTGYSGEKRGIFEGEKRDKRIWNGDWGTRTRNYWYNFNLEHQASLPWIAPERCVTAKL